MQAKQTPPSTPKPVLEDSALYLGDNGRCSCGLHSGMSARLTGRDLSGQRVVRVTPDFLAECLRLGFEPACEECGKVAR